MADESEVQVKVRKAARLLREAYDLSTCKWCARKYDKLAHITSQLADIQPLNDKASSEISKMTDEELAAIGGKVGVLHRIAKGLKTDGNETPVPEYLNIAETNVSERGSIMDKNRAVLIIGGSLAFGTGLGFVLNRVDEMTSAGKPWYMHVGPAVQVLGGAAIAVLGMTGKIFKGESLRTMAVAGGSTMMAQGALWYLESLYKGAVPTSARFAGRYVNARSPGQLPMRVVEETRAY